jgi:hypothetical protein
MSLDNVTRFRNDMVKRMPWLEKYDNMLMSLGFWRLVNEKKPDRASEINKLHVASANCSFTSFDSTVDKKAYFMKLAAVHGSGLDDIENDAVVLRILQTIIGSGSRMSLGEHMMGFCDSFWTFTDASLSTKGIRMADMFDPSLYFPNPNMFDESTYSQRFARLRFFKTLTVDYVPGAYQLSENNMTGMGSKLYTDYCKGYSLDEYYSWLNTKLGDLFVGMLEMGMLTGFTHGDAHTGNVLFNTNTGKFVLIDMGRASLNFNRCGKVIGSITTVDAIIREECLKIDQRIMYGRQVPSHRDFFCQYHNSFRIGSDNNEPANIASSIPVMNDIATIAFDILKAYSIQNVLASIYIPFININEGSYIIIHTNSVYVVDTCLECMRDTTNPFRSLMPGLAWMTMYLQCFLHEGVRLKGTQTTGMDPLAFHMLDYKSIVSNNGPLYFSSQINATHFFNQRESFNKILINAGFRRVIDMIVQERGLPNYEDSVTVASSFLPSVLPLPPLFSDDEDMPNIKNISSMRSNSFDQEEDAFRKYTYAEAHRMLTLKGNFISIGIHNASGFIDLLRLNDSYWAIEYMNINEVEKENIAKQTYYAYSSPASTPGMFGLPPSSLFCSQGAKGGGKTAGSSAKVPKLKRNGVRGGAEVEREAINLEEWDNVYEVKQVMDFPRVAQSVVLLDLPRTFPSYPVAPPTAIGRNSIKPDAGMVAVVGGGRLVPTRPVTSVVRQVLNVASNMSSQKVMVLGKQKIRGHELNKKQLKAICLELKLPCTTHMSKLQLEKLVLSRWAV